MRRAVLCRVPPKHLWSLSWHNFKERHLEAIDSTLFFHATWKSSSFLSELLWWEGKFYSWWGRYRLSAYEPFCSTSGKVCGSRWEFAWRDLLKRFWCQEKSTKKPFLLSYWCKTCSTHYSSTQPSVSPGMTCLLHLWPIPLTKTSVLGMIELGPAVLKPSLHYKWTFW